MENSIREARRASHGSVWKVLLGLLALIVCCSALPTLTSSDEHNDFEVCPEYQEVFQVYHRPQPTIQRCQQTLVQHHFGFSYGRPFVGRYVPPLACGYDFRRVLLNLTTVCMGTQFDRIAFIRLHGIEIWRTSTLEPRRSGSWSSFTRDVTAYSRLFQSPGEVTVELGNLIDENYDGVFNITLEVIFDYGAMGSDVADLIVGISEEVSVLRNSVRAVAKNFASGNAGEEFWYTNVPEEFTDMFGTDLPGHSPFREVRLKVDGRIAGVVWPFPVIFTGGIVPGLWRNIVSIDCFDLQEHEINLSPWLGILTDGKQHDVTLAVFGQNEKELGDWYLSGSLHVWIDEDLKEPECDMVEYSISGDVHTSGAVDASRGEAQMVTTASRQVVATSRIKTSWGWTVRTWQQSLLFRNTQVLAHRGLVQNVTHLTTGMDESLLNDHYIGDGYALRYNYPFSLNFTFTPMAEAFSFEAELAHGKHVHREIPRYLWPREEALQTTQVGKALYRRRYDAKSGSTSGDTKQDYFESRRNDQPYRRHVYAHNGSIEDDDPRFIARFLRT